MRRPLTWLVLLLVSVVIHGLVTSRVGGGIRQQEDAKAALAALAERRADLAEEDHRRVREASLRTGESLRMRFRCEPSLPVDVIGLIVLLPAPTL